MNSTCQIHREFDSFYIVLSQTLNCITLYNHCEHLRVAHIALCDYCKHLRVAYITLCDHCKHSTDYRLHCICDTIRLMLNTTSLLQDFHLEIL